MGLLTIRTVLYYWNLQGPPGYKGLSVSPISPWIPKGRFKQPLSRGVRERRNKGKAVESVAESWLLPPQGIHTTIWYTSELFYRNWGSHPGGGLTSDWAQAYRPQTGWNQLITEIPGMLPCYLTSNQSEEGHTPCSPPPKLAFKNSSLKPTGECRSFEDELPILLAWPLQ